MVYAYIRVSTDKQDCENQKIGIMTKATELGVSVDTFIQDAGISGTRAPEKRALGGCLRKLKSGDIIICSELSRLGRKLFMIMSILEQCMRIGARVYTVKDGYELGDNIQSKVLAFAFALSAEIERDLISQRTREALALRRARGQKLGRPSGHKNHKHKLDNQQSKINKLLATGASKRAIARKLRVSVPTLYNRLNTCYKEIVD